MLSLEVDAHPTHRGTRMPRCHRSRSRPPSARDSAFRRGCRVNPGSANFVVVGQQGLGFAGGQISRTTAPIARKWPHTRSPEIAVVRGKHRRFFSRQPPPKAGPGVTCHRRPRATNGGKYRVSSKDGAPHRVPQISRPSLRPVCGSDLSCARSAPQRDLRPRSSALEPRAAPQPGRSREPLAL
jgi:hypothetical protein